MFHPNARAAIAAICLLTAPSGVFAQTSAQTLDTRAASQRACLEVAQTAGHRVLFLGRPVPIMGRLGRVEGETVRLQVAVPGGRDWLHCVYDINYSQADILLR
jgi:hypothetical protein